MTSASAIKFPFERGKEYELAELKAFEAQLSQARSANHDLGNELRAPETGSPRWIKLRNEELLPVEYYAGHKNLHGATRFMIMPEGSKIDVQLNNSGKIENLQITVADPKWDFPESGSIKHGGYYRRLSTVLLNRDGRGGSGPITKNGDKFAQDRRMVSTPELDGHYGGLLEALEKKFHKPYNDAEVILLVYARKYCEGLSLDRFLDVARNALAEATAKVNVQYKFSSISIVDYAEGYYVEA